MGRVYEGVMVDGWWVMGTSGSRGESSTSPPIAPSRSKPFPFTIAFAAALSRARASRMRSAALPTRGGKSVLGGIGGTRCASEGGRQARTPSARRPKAE